MSKTVIKNVLDAFLGVSIDTDESDDEIKNNNITIAIDEFDTDILSEAIEQALKKEKSNENTNQFQ